MRYTLMLTGLLIALLSTALLATNDTQTLTFTAPKIALVTVDPAIPFHFDTGQTTATGSSRLAISSNDPHTRLNITPTGINLAVSSDAIPCPNQASHTMITCQVGVKRISNGTLFFQATRTQGEMNITYTLVQ